jgi:hypothetical protein
MRSIASTAGRGWNKRGDLSLILDLKSLSVDESYFEPAIKASFSLKYRKTQEAPINIYANVFFKGKIIGRLESKDMLDREFKISPKDYKDYSEETLDIDLACVLTKKIISYMNNSRRSSDKGDVNLQIETCLTYLRNEAEVSYIEEYNIYNTAFPRDLKDAIAKQWPDRLSNNISVLLYVYPIPPGTYSQSRSNLNLISSSGVESNNSYISIKIEKKKLEYIIKSSDWVHDFLPKLGIGEYEVIEIPRIKPESNENLFKDSLSKLETAKNELYNLHTGSSMTALRNSLKSFSDDLINLGYGKKNEKGKSEIDYQKIYGDNNNIALLAQDLQQRLYGASSSLNDDTAAHARQTHIMEGYEAESMIFMAYSLYKMVFEKLKGDE